MSEHEGAPQSNERILLAHSKVSRDWFALPEGATLHAPYKQGHDEQCYLCTLLARIELQEAETRRVFYDAEVIYARLRDAAFRLVEEYAREFRAGPDCVGDGWLDGFRASESPDREFLALRDALAALPPPQAGPDCVPPKMHGSEK